MYYNLKENLQIKGELGQSMYLENHDEKEELFENINLIVDSSWAHPGAIEKFIEKVGLSSSHSTYMGYQEFNCIDRVSC